MHEDDSIDLAAKKQEILVTPREPQIIHPFVEGRGLDVYSSIHSYRDIFFKYRRLILGAALLITFATTTYSIVAKPEYRATARLLVEADNPDVRGDAVSSAPNDDSFLATQANVLRSDS